MPRPRTRSTPASPAARRSRSRRVNRTKSKNGHSDSELTEMVQSYMPLVRHAVNRIAVGSSSSGILQYEDMLSCGMQGPIEAYHAFDPTRGAKFSTYALPRIRGAILDALRAAHPLPRSLQKFSSDVEQATANLHTKLG